MPAHYPMTPENVQHGEAVLLGSLLLHPDAAVLIKDAVQLEDFSEERHRLIYEALNRTWHTGAHHCGCSERPAHGARA